MSIIYVDFKTKRITDAPQLKWSEINSIHQPIQEIPVNWYTEVRIKLETRFGDDLPNHFKKCMAEPQTQPYMHGDVHNIQYIVERSTKFNSPMPVPCEVTMNSCQKIDGVLTLGSKCKEGTDEPFPWMDVKYKCTLNFLRSLPNGTRLYIYTRSDLIAHDDYRLELSRLNVSIRVLYVTKDDDLNRLSEPGAPSF